MEKGQILSWNLHCDTVDHEVTPFIHTFLHAGSHCKEPLVCLKDPGLCYTIIAGPSLGHFLDIRCCPYPAALGPKD